MSAGGIAGVDSRRGAPSWSRRAAGVASFKSVELLAVDLRMSVGGVAGIEGPSRG